MRRSIRKIAIAAGAAMVAVGALGTVPVLAGSISDTSPTMIDGWTISWGTGVGLAINQDATNPNEVDIEKTANFTAPNQGYQITFSPTPGFTGTAATEFVIPDETIVNNTGKSFNGFSFILINTNPSALAMFNGPSSTFIPPSGPGYTYSTVALTSGNTILTYTGTQNNGVTSFWGNGDPSPSGDNLLIDAPAGSDFSLKELSSAGQSSTVPLPAAAWQSLLGLGGLALIGWRRKAKRSRLA